MNGAVGGNHLAVAGTGVNTLDGHSRAHYAGVYDDSTMTAAVVGTH